MKQGDIVWVMARVVDDDPESDHVEVDIMCDRWTLVEPPKADGGGNQRMIPACEYRRRDVRTQDETP